MDVKGQVRDYILKYRNSYPKVHIISQLKLSGVSIEVIDEVYSSLKQKHDDKLADSLDKLDVDDEYEKKEKVNNQIKKKGSLLDKRLIHSILGIMFGLFIPIFGLVLIGWGIKSAFRHRQEMDDDASLLVVIFGGIIFFLALYLHLFIIFSFVDFNNLLPTQVKFNDGRFIGLASESFFDENKLYVSFYYTGNLPVVIDGSKSEAYDLDGNLCEFDTLTNLDANKNGDLIKFYIGNLGFITFDCNSFERGSFLSMKKNFEGNLELYTQKSEMMILGDIRVKITG